MRQSRAHTSVYHGERRFFYAALTFVLGTFFAYGYLVSASVMHVVLHKDLGRQIASASSEVSTLEAAYIDAQHKVSVDIAERAGLAAAPEKVFIDTRTSTLVLNEN